MIRERKDAVRSVTSSQPSHIENLGRNTYVAMVSNSNARVAPRRLYNLLRYSSDNTSAELVWNGTTLESRKTIG